MAEEAIAAPEALPETEDMEVELEAVKDAAENGGVEAKSLKRAACEEGGEEENGEKRQKFEEEEKSVEEERLEKKNTGEEGEIVVSAEVKLGPKTFGSAVEIFDYFFKILHLWPTNLRLNKYEQMVLLDLLKKGHAEANRKIGVGIKSFQVRYHPLWKSRCFFLIREDESFEDFSFRKCIDNILPLPENMKGNSEANKALGGRGGGGFRGRGGRGGRGRGKPRN